jgi:transcriptional regulator with XRE-family HTH domain
MDERARAVKPTEGGELRCLRRTLGVSLEALANRTGLEPSQIERIEAGEVRPRPVVLAALALALGTTRAGRRQWLAADTCFERLVGAGRAADGSHPGAMGGPPTHARRRLRTVEPCLACGRPADADLAWEAGGYGEYPLLAPLCGRPGCPPSKVRADMIRGIYGDADYVGPDGLLTTAIWQAVTRAQLARGVADSAGVAQADEAAARAESEAGRWAADRMGDLLRPNK